MTKIQDDEAKRKYLFSRNRQLPLMKVGVIVNRYLQTYIAYKPKHHKTLYICSCKVDTNTINNTTHTRTHTYTHTYSCTFLTTNAKTKPYLLYLGKKNEIEILEIITTKAATTFNHFTTLNEMEMVCLRNEFFHPATTQRYMQNLFYCFCQPKSSTHNITSLCDARLN